MLFFNRLFHSCALNHMTYELRLSTVTIVTCPMIIPYLKRKTNLKKCIKIIGRRISLGSKSEVSWRIVGTHLVPLTYPVWLGCSCVRQILFICTAQVPCWLKFQFWPPEQKSLWPINDTYVGIYFDLMDLMPPSFYHRKARRRE